MKKILLSTVAFVGLTAGAMAADLPVRTMAPAPQPVFVAPAFTWTGFYIGAHVGYGFGDDDDFGFDGDLTAPVNPTLGGGTRFIRDAGGGNFFNAGRSGGAEGLLGGGQVGFNLQAGMFVFGIEADVSLTDFDEGDSGFFGDANGFGTTAAGGAGGAAGFGAAAVVAGQPGNVAFFNNGGFGSAASIDYFGTVRGKVGIAFDRMMIYATGGLAWAEYENNGMGGFSGGANVPAGFFTGPAAITAANGVNSTFGNRTSDDNWGWTVGGGLEWAFTNNLSFKIEGLYVNFDGDDDDNGNEVVGVTNTGAAVTANDIGFSSERDFALVRAGLNFRFGSF